MAKNISNNFSREYSKKFLDHVKQSATYTLATASKRAIQKPAEATNDLIGNRIAQIIRKVCMAFLRNNLETVTNETENIKDDKE